MLYLDEEQLKERLPEVIHKTINAGRGRTEGSENISKEMRVAVGTLARVVGPTVAAQALDVTEAQASSLSHGKISHKQGQSIELKNKIDERLGIIHNAALDKLLIGINAIDEDKLAESKPRDLAAFAKDMSAVYKNTSEQGNVINAGQVIIYTPAQNSMDDYEAPIDITPVQN